MTRLAQVRGQRQWLSSLVIGVALLLGLTFLGKPPAPLMIVVDNGGRLGLVKMNQFKTHLRKPLPEYIAWSRVVPSHGESELDYFRDGLRGVASGDSLLSPSGLNWIKRSPAFLAQTESVDFDIKLTVDEVSQDYIWREQTRDNLGVPIPFPPLNQLLTSAPPGVTVPSSDATSIRFPVHSRSILPPRVASAAPTRRLADVPTHTPALSFVPFSIRASRPRLHIARIPPRAERPKGKLGHMAPDADREAVWLKTITINRASPNQAVAMGATRESGRARELESGDYSVGWLLVFTQCDRKGACDLVTDGEADCLQPETLANHVLGMAHLIVPRGLLNSRGGFGLDVNLFKRGGGNVLLTRADYDHVSLHVSHFSAGGRKPSAPDETKDPSESEPSASRETTIAMLDERLHEIVPQVDRAKNLNDGDYVLILPTALDFTLGEKDYLIVSLDGVPAPLRSHYRGVDEPDSAAPTKRVGGGAMLASAPAQDLKPAARIRAEVEE